MSSSSYGISKSIEFQRPRRPNADTLTYCAALPVDHLVFNREIVSKRDGTDPNDNSQRDDDDDDDDPNLHPMLTASQNAIISIKNEIASLAGDPGGSAYLEQYARVTGTARDELSIRRLLRGVRDYMIHLSSHRYGSHVVQTVLTSVLRVYAVSDVPVLTHDEEEEEGEDLESLEDILYGICQELAPHSRELAVHVCGSHVIRALVCVFSGLDLVEAPGSGGVYNPNSKKKKKKKKKYKDPDNGGGGGGRMTQPQFTRVEYPTSLQKTFRECLDALCKSLIYGDDYPSKDPSQELIEMACHPSAGPLLLLVLRSLSSLDHPVPSHQQDPKRVLKKVNDVPQDHRFQPSSRGEHYVHTLLCWSDPDRRAENVRTLSLDSRGSIVLETVLRCSHDELHGELLDILGFSDADAVGEYLQHDVGNYILQAVLSGVRNERDAKKVYAAFEASGSAVWDCVARKDRRGVFWRLSEMCAQFKIGQEHFLTAMRGGFRADISSSSSSSDNPSNEDCVLALLDLKDGREDGRLGLDASGTKTVYNLLHFDPELVAFVPDAILSRLDASELESLAKDGMGSKCVMDGILDNPNRTHASFARNIESLLEKLAGRWTHLAADRVGQHTVTKLFRCLEMEKKAVLVEELMTGTKKLMGCAMGRSVMEICAVRDFVEGGEEGWRKVIAQREKPVGTWLDEIVGGEGGPTKKKRKRRKKGGNAAKEDKDVKVSMIEVEKPKSSSVESIMSVLLESSTVGEDKEEKTDKKKRKRKKKTTV